MTDRRAAYGVVVLGELVHDAVCADPPKRASGLRPALCAEERQTITSITAMWVGVSSPDVIARSQR